MAPSLCSMVPFAHPPAGHWLPYVTRSADVPTRHLQGRRSLQRLRRRVQQLHVRDCVHQVQRELRAVGHHMRCVWGLAACSWIVYATWLPRSATHVKVCVPRPTLFAVDTCPDGTYKDASNICQACPNNCTTCTDAYTCTACLAPSMLTINSLATPPFQLCGGERRTAAAPMRARCWQGACRLPPSLQCARVARVCCIGCFRSLA